MERSTMGSTTLMRVDDSIDERQRDLAHALNDEFGIIEVSPVPNGNNVRVYYERNAGRKIFSEGRDHGFVPVDQSEQDAKDARSRIRAFTGRWKGFEQETLQYIDLAPCDVPSFTCDWCDEHKRGERSARRYKPEEHQTEGYPKDMWTLCRDCDPEYDSENDEWDHAAAEDHPRLGNQV